MQVDVGELRARLRKHNQTTIRQLFAASIRNNFVFSSRSSLKMLDTTGSSAALQVLKIERQFTAKVLARLEFRAGGSWTTRRAQSTSRPFFTVARGPLRFKECRRRHGTTSLLQKERVEGTTAITRLLRLINRRALHAPTCFEYRAGWAGRSKHGGKKSNLDQK